MNETQELKNIVMSIAFMKLKQSLDSTGQNFLGIISQLMIQIQCASIDIVPWDNLIITYDNADGIIDLRIVESEIKNKLLVGL